MKKVLIIAMLAFFGMTQAQVTFKPGLRGGVNFSHFTKGDEYNGYYDNNRNYVNGVYRDEFSSKTDFYLGFYGALHLTKYYTLQPEIDYSRQGAEYKGRLGEADFTYEVSYLSIAVVNKFTFSDKFNIHVGPTIDIQVEDNFPTENEIDFAFILGAGYNFTKNFGIEARVKKGIIPVIDSYTDTFYGGNDHTNVVFSVGATYTFDLK
ncbi:MAG: outer membrane beta-barrel protein [Bacteroidota bacterium]